LLRLLDALSWHPKAGRSKRYFPTFGATDSLLQCPGTDNFNSTQKNQDKVKVKYSHNRLGDFSQEKKLYTFGL